MAESEKQSFVLYFDAYPSVEELPPDQRGELLILLFRYAMAADQGPADPEVLLAEYPCLDGEARMAYRFLAETVRRDPEWWTAQLRRCQEAARRRMEAGEVPFARRRPPRRRSCPARRRGSTSEGDSTAGRLRFSRRRATLWAR